MNKIVITSPMDLSAGQLDRLKRLGPLIINEIEPDSSAEWLDRCRGFKYVCSGKSGMTWSMRVGRDPKDLAIYHLEPGTFVAHPFVNVAMIDRARLQEGKIELGYAPGSNKLAVTEWVLSMLLRYFREIEYMINWNKPGDKTCPIGRMPGIADRKITILGPGNVGKAIEYTLRSLGADVTFFGRADHDNDQSGDLRLPMRIVEDLHQSVADADAVINCLSSNPENTNLLDAAFFAAMKKFSYFITMTNPAIWNIEDLLAAVDSGHLEGAAIDIGNKGPGDLTAETYQKVVGHSGILATAQIAHWTEGSAKRSFDMMVANIEAAVNGARIPFAWA